MRDMGAAALAIALTACGSSGPRSSPSSTGSSGTEEAHGADGETLPVPSSVGQGEGQLNLIAWAGYTHNRNGSSRSSPADRGVR